MVTGTEGIGHSLLNCAWARTILYGIWTDVISSVEYLTKNKHSVSMDPSYMSASAKVDHVFLQIIATQSKTVSEINTALE